MKHQISKLLAMTAMTLLLIHIADGSIERISNHGFLPVSMDKRPFGPSNFGISSIILFFVAFGIDIREKKTTKVTTTLLLVGGAIIGTTALGGSSNGCQNRIDSNFFDGNCTGIWNNGIRHLESNPAEEED